AAPHQFGRGTRVQSVLDELSKVLVEFFEASAALRTNLQLLKKLQVARGERGGVPQSGEGASIVAQFLLEQAGRAHEQGGAAFWLLVLVGHVSIDVHEGAPSGICSQGRTLLVKIRGQALDALEKLHVSKRRGHGLA